MEQNETERNGMERSELKSDFFSIGTEQNGTERNGMERNESKSNFFSNRNGTKWNGTERNGMERIKITFFEFRMERNESKSVLL